MALQVGDRIPKFTAIDSNGNVFDSSSIVGVKPAVFYFYPKDDTPGCTKQACGFRDQYEDFKDLGAEVIGISSDDLDSHQNFIKKYQLPFILLSDTEKKIKTLFGVKPNFFGLIPGRVTYIVDRNGVIQLIFDSFVAENHILNALAKIKKIVE
ncbi:peroxiredoxin [Flavobacterium cellulosilyticum]|uniref:thioredoxin-dependent peroxiredoxin n=1 Tax=Flavobacterium cellulosilyticum TaxID=2541731 RepID=A0A4R5CD36_9FLAO|nr:peroxiredoxin [Flavobacterium cellulosilyticum]TDD97385.1 peroxiredoxin [Flavobacterium cellulosilyticum]